jgi:hypothetical protein
LGNHNWNKIVDWEKLGMSKKFSDGIHRL